MPERDLGVWPYDRTRRAVLTPMRRGLAWIMELKPAEKRRRKAVHRRRSRRARPYPPDPVTLILRAIAHDRAWDFR